MAGLRDIRQRIRIVRNIQKITSAMQMVAAARLKRAQDRVGAARPYAEKMAEVMSNLSRATTDISHPLLETRDPQRLAVVVVTADRGLCGSYNTNIIRQAVQLLRAHAELEAVVLPVGNRGPASFRRLGYTVGATFPLPSRDVLLSDAQAITAEVRRLFESGAVDLVYLVYTRFYSALRLQPTVQQLLPLQTPQAEGVATAEEYLFEPEPHRLLANLLPRYLDMQVFQALVESVASEQGARMTSMRSASDNAAEMIDRLTLSFNRARQAAITKEIAEIVGGADALKG
ncbi:MAG: ATP synthase F1 subunit gamma [Armatimonadetes bacterium]|jgi:F-type H+-transporting ATPase subunit gamma|nr:ATP synthase F1 subunit gamma [Armatimonadota bacterium]